LNLNLNLKWNFEIRKKNKKRKKRDKTSPEPAYHVLAHQGKSPAQPSHHRAPTTWSRTSATVSPALTSLPQSVTCRTCASARAPRAPFSHLPQQISPRMAGARRPRAVRCALDHDRDLIGSTAGLVSPSLSSYLRGPATPLPVCRSHHHRGRERTCGRTRCGRPCRLLGTQQRVWVLGRVAGEPCIQSGEAS
jgi:hypothetical protein